MTDTDTTSCIKICEHQSNKIPPKIIHDAMTNGGNVFRANVGNVFRAITKNLPRNMICVYMVIDCPMYWPHTMEIPHYEKD